MFLSNYESLLVYDTNITLSQKSKEYKNNQKVNKSISFNSIKQKSFALFYSNLDIDTTLKEMQKLFITATGTDQGKTLVTAALLWQLRRQGRAVSALKPVVSGGVGTILVVLVTALAVPAIRKYDRLR